MKLCFVIVYLCVNVITAAAQITTPKTKPLNFFYVLQDKAPVTDSLKMLDSLIHVGRGYELLRFAAHVGYMVTYDYNLIYKKGNEWVFFHGYSDGSKKRTILPASFNETAFTGSSVPGAHGLFQYTDNPSPDDYGYYLVKDGKIVQSLLCNDRMLDIANQDLRQTMEVFELIDKVW